MGAKLTTQVVRPEPLLAPILTGQQVGMLKITNAGQALAEVPLLALRGVEESGVIGRAWDTVRLWIK
jgi:D-alanyl-D-alanine carboxypeptidase (penicillin-binding protein 5/6)